MTALYLFEFLFFVFSVLYPNGQLILGNKENFVVKINIGILVSVVIYYVLTILRLSFLVTPILLSPLVYLVLSNKFKLSKIKVDFLLLIILLVITLIQSSINFTSGDAVNGGLRLINAHAEDSMWMVALTQSVERGIPPTNPGDPQVLVQNYHYFLNVFIAAAQSFTKIPLIPLYLKIISPFLLFMFAATIYVFFRKLIKSKWWAIAGVLMVTLSSNLFYLVSIFHPQASITPSIFWANEYETHIVNYQLLLSYILLTSLLYLLLQKNKSVLLLSILAGSLVAFKSFASVTLLPSLGIVAFFELLRKKYFYLKLAALTALFTLVFYLTANPTFQSQFIFQPFYLIQTMFVTADHINYPDWILKIQTYISEGNTKRVIQFYTEGVLLFIIGNLGLKILGFKVMFKNTITKLLGLISIFGLTASMLLVSKGVAWNTIQFFYFTVFASAILFIYYLHNLSVKHRTTSVVLFSVAFLSLTPGVWYVTNSYLSKLSENPNNENLYRAAVLLSQKPKGVVLVDPKYSSTSFVAAISGQPTFLTNPGMLDVQLINYKNAKPENVKYELIEKNGKPQVFQLGSPVPLQ